MPTDQHPQSGRRQHFHRGRRGHDRRGDRRSPPPPQSQGQSQEPGSGEHADVDQIIKEIKARISQRHGIDLSAQQIQELAARRLEAILDPRTIKPGLLEQLRRAAGGAADLAPAEPPDAYTFEDHTIYDTHNGLLRFIRRLFAPILKLFFNPNPIASALNAQVKVNRDAARRESERERTQAEWNSLHYTLLQRIVTEVSRVSLEMQSLSLRVESLATRVDFTERRIRGLETTPAPPPAQRTFDQPAASGPTSPASPPPRASGETTSPDTQSDGARRKRRRRRGRRGSVPGGDAIGGGPSAPQSSSEPIEADDDGYDDAPEAGEAQDAPEPAASVAPAAPADERPPTAAAAPPPPEPSDT
jgi:hypothetical protein